MTAKLRFLRLALGPANSGATTQAREYTEAYFLKGFPQGDWKLDWPKDQTLVGSSDHTKLLLNLICLAQDCLPRGGVIAVRPQGKIVVTALGGAPVLGDSVQGLQASDLANVAPRAAQGVYAAGLARRLSQQIDAHLQDGSVSFSLRALSGP
jgi:histidine phosphotransferase ChpT